jgi:hypothetical protein
MASVNTLIDRLRRRMRDWSAIDVSTAQITNVATVLPVSDGTLYRAGDKVVLDQEMMYITGVATNSLTVRRAYLGTTAATHVTASTVLMNQGLRELWPYFFKRVEDTSLISVINQQDYAMPAAFGESGRVLRIRYLEPGGTPNMERELRNFEHRRGVGGSANTIAVTGVSFVGGCTLRLIGLAPFTTDMAFAGVTDTSLIDSGVEALVMYAEYYLKSADEYERERTRGAKGVGGSAVPAGASASAADRALAKFTRYCQQHAQPWPNFYTRRRF